MRNCVLIIQLAILLVHTNSRLDHTITPWKKMCSLEDKLATYEWHQMECNYSALRRMIHVHESGGWSSNLIQYHLAYLHVQYQPALTWLPNDCFRITALWRGSNSCKTLYLFRLPRHCTNSWSCKHKLSIKSILGWLQGKGREETYKFFSLVHLH